MRWAIDCRHEDLSRGLTVETNESRTSRQQNCIELSPIGEATKWPRAVFPAGPGRAAGAAAAGPAPGGRKKNLRGEDVRFYFFETFPTPFACGADPRRPFHHWFCCRRGLPPPPRPPRRPPR